MGSCCLLHPGHRLQETERRFKGVGRVRAAAGLSAGASQTLLPLQLPASPPGVLQLPAPSTRPARGTRHRICCTARSLCCAQPEAREWPLRHNSTRNFCPSVLGELPVPLPAGKGSPGRGVWSYSPISTPFIHWHHLKQALVSRNLCARSTLQPLSPPGTSSPLHRHL